MVHAVRILMVTVVVVLMVCNDHVECKRKRDRGKSKMLQNDTRRVSLGGNEEHKKLAPKSSNQDCQDCGNDDDLDLKRRRQGKRRNKKFSKRPPSSSSHSNSLSNYYDSFWKKEASDRPSVTEKSENVPNETSNTEIQSNKSMLSDSKAKSKILTNYYSSFWKSENKKSKTSSIHKDSEKESPTQINEKKSKKDKNFKKNKGKDKNQKKNTDKKVKQDRDFKDSIANEKIFQNFYSSFWDDEDEFKDSFKKDSKKTSKTESKDEISVDKSFSKKDKILDSKTNLQLAKDSKVESPKVNTKNADRKDNDRVDEIFKELKNKRKRKKSKKKKANRERNRENKEEDVTSENKEEKKNQKAKRKDKKERLRSHRKDGKESPNSKNKDKVEHLTSEDKKVKKDKKRNRKERLKLQNESSKYENNIKEELSITKNMDENIDLSKGKVKKGHTKSQDRDKEERLQSEGREEKESSIDRTSKKNSFSEEKDVGKSDIIIDIEMQSSENEGEEEASKNMKGELNKSKTKDVSKARKGRKRKKKTNHQGKANRENKIHKSEDKDASVDTSKTDNNIVSETKNPKKDNSNRDSLIDFQDVKEKSDSEGKGKEPLSNDEDSKPSSESSKKPDHRLPTDSEADAKKVSVQNRTMEIREQRIIEHGIKLNHSKNNTIKLVPNRTGNNTNFETKDDDKTFVIKKLDTNSQRLNFDKMLKRAQKSFQRKEKRIMRKLTVLNQTTKKRFNDFLNVNQTYHSHAVPYIKMNFNFSQANGQFGGSRMSSVNLKNMIMNLHPNSPRQNNFDTMILKPQDSNTSISLVEENLLYTLPQGDDPTIKEISRQYLISKNKERKRLARKRKRKKILKDLERKEKEELSSQRSPIKTKNVGIETKKKILKQTLYKGDKDSKRKDEQNKVLSKKRGKENSSKTSNLDSPFSSQKLKKSRGKKRKRKQRNRSKKKSQSDRVNSDVNVTLNAHKDEATEKVINYDNKLSRKDTKKRKRNKNNKKDIKVKSDSHRDENDPVLMRKEKKKKYDITQSKKVTNSETDPVSNSAVSLLSYYLRGSEMAERWIMDDARVLRKELKSKRAKSVTNSKAISKNERQNSLSRDLEQNETAEKMINEDNKDLKKIRKKTKKFAKKDRKPMTSGSKSTMSLLTFYLGKNKIINKIKSDDTNVLRKDKKKVRKDSRKMMKSESVTKSDTLLKKDGPDSLSINPDQNMMNDDSRVLRKRTKKKKKKKKVKKGKEIKKAKTGVKKDSTVSLQSGDPYKNETSDKMMNDDVKMSRKKRRKWKKRKWMIKSKRKQQNDGTYPNLMRSLDSARSKKHHMPQLKSANAMTSKRTRRKKNKSRKQLMPNSLQTSVRNQSRSNSRHYHLTFRLHPKYYIKENYRYPSRLKKYRLKGSDKSVVQQVRRLKQKHTRGRSRRYRNRSKLQQRLQRLRPKSGEKKHQKGERSSVMNKVQKFRDEDRNYQRDRDFNNDNHRNRRPSRTLRRKNRNDNNYKLNRDSRRYYNRDQNFDNEEDVYTSDSYEEDFNGENGHSESDQVSRRNDGQNHFRQVDDYFRRGRGFRRYPIESDRSKERYVNRKRTKLRASRRFDDLAVDDRFFEDDTDTDQEVFRDEDGDMYYPGDDESFELEYIYPRRRDRGPRRHTAKGSRRYDMQSYRGRTYRHQNGKYYHDDESAYYDARQPDSRRYDQEQDIIVGRYYYSKPIYQRRRGYGGDMDSNYDGYDDSSREEDRVFGGLQRSRSDRGRRHKSRTHSRKYGRDEYITDHDDGRDDYESQRESRREQNLQRGRGSGTNQRLDPYRYDRFGNERDRSRQPYRPNPYHDDMERERQARLKAQEYQRKLKIQRVLPVLSQKYQRIKHELQGVLRYYSNAMQNGEDLYQDIFNGTRYDIMNGMGVIYEKLYSANDDIYDAVMRSSQITHSIYKKALQDREAQLQGLPSDDPEPDIVGARSMVKIRDFRQNRIKAQYENRNLAQENRKLKILNMRCMQIKARLQQVKEHLKERYDHQTVIDLFNNMRSSIYYLNEGLAASYGLGQFRRDKSYITYVKEEVDAAKSAIKSSKESVRIGIRKYVECNKKFENWEREKKMRQRRKAQRDGPRSSSSLNPYQINQLRQFTAKCKRHSLELKQTAHFIQGTLQQPIHNAKRALQQKGKGVTVNHLNLYIPKLKGDVQDMFVALDDLRMYVEKQPIVVIPPRKCKETIEGSGSDSETENDDDFECIEEEGEGPTHGNLIIEGGNEDDDFTFEENDEEKPEVLVTNPMKAFGIQLNQLLTQVLRKSENMHESLQAVIGANNGLEDLLEKMRSNTSIKEKHFTIRKDIQANLITLKMDRKEMFSRLQQISLTVEKLHEIDFNELQSVAAEAIKMAKEKSGNRKDISIEENGTTTDKTEDEKNNEKTDEKWDEKKEGSNEEKEAEKEEGAGVSSSEEKILTEIGVGKGEDLGQSGLWKIGADIQSNTEDIKNLQSLAVNAYTKSCSKMNKIHTNISTLMQKVQQARNMLNSLQLSVSKDGDSPIPVPIDSNPADNSNSLVTSMSVCIKTKTLDGTVLYMQGNQSASYTISLDDGELSATVYDAESDDLETLTLDEYLEENEWYTIRLIRAGQTLNMTVKGQDEEFQQGSIQIDEMPTLQPPFLNSFIGGIPEDSEISGSPWQGCVGELILDGRSMSVFQPALDGQKPSLCSNHCISQDKMLSWSFDGDGYVYYTRPPQETIESISVYFKTMQPTGSILSATNRRKRLNLLVSMDKGAIKVQTSNGVEYAVLLSINGSLNDGNIHVLKIKYIEGKTYPELDGDNSAFSVEKSQPKLYRHIKNGILLGSFISDQGEYLHQRHRPLIGCVGKLAINEIPILSTDATEVYHAYHGLCDMKTVWQTCTKFTATSVPLSFGSVENSNTISLLVDRNASGPLLLYDKEDSYQMLINITDTSVNILGKGSESALVKTESGDDNGFFLLTVKDTGRKVYVSAYEQSSSISYGGWFSSDTESPHTITLGQPREEGEQTFEGSISQLLVGERLYDLTVHHVPNKLDVCKRPLRPITLNVIHDAEDKNFCS